MTAIRRSVILALACASAGAAHAQDSASASGERTTMLGSYTESQARKGEEAYRKFCSECHTPRFYASRAFRQTWNGRSVFDLFELIRTTMPGDRPGRLSRGQYADIVAYLFRLNGMPAGDQALSTEEVGLTRIRIEAPVPPPPA